MAATNIARFPGLKIKEQIDRTLHITKQASAAAFQGE